MGKMKGIKSGTRKAKGRQLQQETAERISRFTGLPWGKDQPIESRPMGQTGVDIRLDREARKLFPFSVECKWEESWDIPSYIRQAQSNQMEGTDWMVCVRKSRSDPIVIMDADAFFRILGEKIPPERFKRKQ